MPRRSVLAVVGWLAAAVLGTLTGLAAVNVIGDGVTGPSGEVLSADRVAAELASSDPAAGAATPPTSPTSSPVSPTPPASSPDASPAGTPGAGPSPGPDQPGAGGGLAQVVVTPGGTVVARCDGALVTLASWTPAQGFGVGEVERGPDKEAELTFTSATGSVEIEVTCAAGQPVASWKWDD